MSTFTLPNSNPECPIRLPSDLSKDQLLSFPAFKTWISTLQHSLSIQGNKSHVFHSAPYKLRTVNVQTVDFFSGGRLGFSKHIFGVVETHLDLIMSFETCFRSTYSASVFHTL